MTRVIATTGLALLLTVGLTAGLTAGLTGCEAEPADVEDCNDGVDNDDDRLTDCQDPDCAGHSQCPDEVCTDDVDNDRDGLTDCDDPQCDQHPACTGGELLCADDLDNDNDGLTDCEDADCQTAPDCQPEGCGNGSVEPPEDCDGVDLGGDTCESFGFTGGTLLCRSDCVHDVSGCTGCGGYVVPTEAPNCQDCAESTCCAELAACYTGSACAALSDCNEQCGDDAGCRQQCADDHPGGLAPAQALRQCLANQCPAECPPGICDSGKTSGFAQVDQCLSDHCCATFAPCADDAGCSPCLTNPSATGCDTDSLYQDYAACADSQCPLTMCGEPLVWADTQGQPIIGCHRCLENANCCGDLSLCMAGGTPTEVDECRLCLVNDPSCPGGAIAQAAADFTACFSTNCAADCPSP